MEPKKATWGEPFDTYPEKAWDKLWAVNVKAIFHLTRACRNMLKAAGTEANPSRIINISSVASTFFIPIYSITSSHLRMPGRYGNQTGQCLRIQCNKGSSQSANPRIGSGIGDR